MEIKNSMEIKKYMLQFLTLKKTKNKYIHTKPQMQLHHRKKALAFTDSLIAETKVKKENLTPTSQGK